MHVSYDELWAFMRRVLCQGCDIQIDYQEGYLRNYEEYSARLDVAARERVNQLDQLDREPQEPPCPS